MNSKPENWHEERRTSEERKTCYTLCISVPLGMWPVDAVFKALLLQTLKGSSVTAERCSITGL